MGPGLLEICPQHNRRKEAKGQNWREEARGRGGEEGRRETEELQGGPDLSQAPPQPFRAKGGYFSLPGGTVGNGSEVSKL